jgi:hypothetical protein
MTIPVMFRLFRVLTSIMLGRRLPMFTILLWQRQYIIVVDETITSLKLNLFSFFRLYLLLLSASWRGSGLPWYISVIRQTVRCWTPVFSLDSSGLLFFVVDSLSRHTIISYSNMESPRKRLTKYWCSTPHCLSDNRNISRQTASPSWCWQQQ